MSLNADVHINFPSVKHMPILYAQAGLFCHLAKEQNFWNRSTFLKRKKARYLSPLIFRNANHFIRKLNESKQTKQNNLNVTIAIFSQHKRIRTSLLLENKFIPSVTFRKGH